MAIMDIHGTEDDIIPANVSNGLGPGPHGSTTSSDGFYYTPTDTVMEKWASRNECSGEPYQYVTEVRSPLLLSAQPAPPPPPPPPPIPLTLLNKQ